MGLLELRGCQWWVTHLWMTPKDAFFFQKKWHGPWCEALLMKRVYLGVVLHQREAMLWQLHKSPEGHEVKKNALLLTWKWAQVGFPTASLTESNMMSVTSSLRKLSWMLEALAHGSYMLSDGNYSKNGQLKLVLCPVLKVLSIFQQLLDNGKSLSMLKVYVTAIFVVDGTLLGAHRHIMFPRGARHFPKSLVWGPPPCVRDS